MENRRAENIMQSHGVISVTYNGMPVWLESVHGDTAQVTLIDEGKTVNVPVSALAEAEPMQTM